MGTLESIFIIEKFYAHVTDWAQIENSWRDRKR